MALTPRENRQYEQEAKKIFLDVEDLTGKLTNYKVLLDTHDEGLTDLDTVLGTLSAAARDTINALAIIVKLRAEQASGKAEYETTIAGLRSSFGVVRANANANPLLTQAEKDAVSTAKTDEV